MSTTRCEQIGKQISDLVEGRVPVITMGELAERRCKLVEPGVSRLAVRRRTTVVIATAAAAVTISVMDLWRRPWQARGYGTPTGNASPAAGQAHHCDGAPHRQGVRPRPRLGRPRAGRLRRRGRHDPRWIGDVGYQFSGQNFNSISRQPNTKPFTERVVDGQFYTLGDPPPGQPLQWYHSTNETSGGVVAVPDPRKLLTALQPAAGFEVIRKQVIGGVPTTHLRATNVRGVNARLLSLDTADQPVSRLDIWVDDSRVVWLIAVRCEGISTPSQETEVDTISIRFVDIGQPQTISAPAQDGNEVTDG